MRKILGALLLFCLLIPFCAFADMEVQLNADKIVIGEWISAGVLEGNGKTFVYSMEKEDKLLFEGLPTAETEGWYLPEKTGEYTLHVAVTDIKGEITELSRSFEVCEEPSCTIVCDAEQIALGESIQVTAEVTGGTGNFTYDCSVIVDNACIDRVITKENAFSITPSQEGETLLRLTVTDQGGHACTAEYTLQVTQGNDIQVTGDTGAFHAAGGLRIWQVSAPGIWQADADADFITLHRFCGVDGDGLVFSVSENDGKTAREGTITLHCGDKTLAVNVHQTHTFPMETEVYLEPVADAIFVDGDTLCAWNYAEGRRTFRVEASGLWEAVCDQDFVTLNQIDGELTVVLEDNDTASVREATVVFTCGRAQAVLHISQPAVFAGADVKSVRLDKESGTAYQDAVNAFVITSADVEQLIVSSCMWQQPLMQEKDAAVSYQEDELLWQVTLPLQGAGEQEVLFSAQGILGTDEKILTAVAVNPEMPDFEGTAPEITLNETGTQINVLLTRSAEHIVLQDETGAEIAAYTPQDAFVDYALHGDPNGRYVRWSLDVPPDAGPAQLMIGDKTMSIRNPEEADEPEFILYSQQNTLWDDVKYRHSDLETSGCAIFALSHVLQLLGYEGEEILPANLADEYAFCLVEGGTLNSTLIGNAGKNLGFKTRFDLYENLPEIVEKTRQGAMWSFMVAKGHIAAVVGVSEDGKMFRIIDSAPSATFERIENTSMYLQNEDGAFVPITDLADVPGARFYLETNGYNGMEYWLEASYVARQGVRLIMPVEEE